MAPEKCFWQLDLVRQIWMTSHAKQTLQKQLSAAISQTNPMEQALRQAAFHMVRLYLSCSAQRIFRICVAEADRFPELARTFYEHGPMTELMHFKAYFGQAIERGELRIADVDLAANQFNEFCKAALWVKCIFGLQSTFSEDQISRVANCEIKS
jgi:TetR/AcrR family transcriptional repressor of mexJK operon